MATKLTKSELERRIFEALLPLTGMVLVPGTLKQKNPPAPDIECEVVSLGSLAVELVALDAQGTRTRLNNMFDTDGAWEKALTRWGPSERARLNAECANVILGLQIENGAGSRARKQIFEEVQKFLLAAPEGFTGNLFSYKELPKGLIAARVSRGSITQGPRIVAPSAGSWLMPQIEKIEEKLTDKAYQTSAPLELFAYSTHDEVDAHVNSLSLIDSCVRTHIEDSQFQRVRVFDLGFRQLNTRIPTRSRKIRTSALRIAFEDRLEQPQSKAPAVRSFHLQGGCRSNDVGGRLRFILPTSNGKLLELTTPSFHHAYGTLRKAGFLIVGADFYFGVDQTDGRRLPDWRAHHPIQGTSWPCADQADKWAHVAHAAIRRKNGLLWDVATRVSRQLRTCDWRLREVSESYHKQLVSRILSKDFTDGERFVDGFTWLGYLAIQAFLVDACTLRDYLAEYRALLLVQSGHTGFSSKIRRLGSLKKSYLDKEPLTIPVDKNMRAASEPGGWLHVLGSYRDLVVHYAPLADAGHTLYAVCVSVPIDAQTTLPSIKLPLPPDPEKVTAGRISGAHVNDPEQNYARFLNALEDPSSAQDGLQYAHTALGHLAALATELLQISPVPPEMPALTQADILDLKIIDPTK
jgi:hypothetical protein